MARLIDSSVIIEIERRGEVRGIGHALIDGQEIAISSITASELLLGIERATSAKHRSQREEFIQSILSELPVLPFDLEVARVHAKVWADLLAIGQMIGQHDLLIAATALVHNFPLITYNLRHFERVPGLVVERPNW
jgi:predicted nucleic acid-binding protein